MSIKEIDARYSQLSESSCCLSCGGAINYAEAQEGEVCVDLGSGRGNDVIRMAESVGEKGHVYGIDISEGMIAKANANLAKFEVTNATIIKSQLERLPLPKDGVDLVISNCTINHSSDKQAVWNEVYRILKDGGRFVVSDIYATKPIAEEYRNDPEAIAECWAGSVTRLEYIMMLERAGFNEIKILEESLPYEKGKAEVASFTIFGRKTVGCGCV
ncbi:MAG: methyltransferase domain-containing protein [Bacteroidales bacterium]|nr:methyltransferase domain-containing protein [Bacteroidales bacterium]